MDITHPSPAAQRSTSHPSADVILNTIEDAVIVTGLDLTILEWNTAATKIFGWSHDEAAGMSLSKLDAPEAAESFAAAARRTLASGTRWSGEIQFSIKGGAAGLCEAQMLVMNSGNLLLCIRDVSQRQRQNEALLEERRLLRTIIDGVPDMLFLKDREARHVMRNRAERELMGGSDEDVFGRTVMELGLPAEISGPFYADDLHVLKTGEPVVNREEKILTRTGELRWLSTTKHPIFDTTGNVIGIVGIARDITEQKRVASELNEARLQLTNHLDNSLLAITEMDRDGRITSWNKRATEMFEWTAEEAIGKTADELRVIHPEEASRVSALFERLTRGSETQNTSINRNLTKSGRVVHCNWFNSAVRASDGSIRSYLCMAADITATIEAIEKLNASDRLLQTLIEATNTGYMMIAPDGTILDANDKYLRFFGAANKADLSGKNLSSLVAEHHSALLNTAFSRLLEESSLRNLELDLHGGLNATVPFEFNARTEQTRDGLRVHLFFRDITTRRRALDERQIIERKLQETQKLESLGVLAGGIAHDFNNILTGILGHASIAADTVGSGSPLFANLEQIQTAALRAADLCKQMLAYSGKGRFVVEKHDLNGLLRDTVSLLELSVSKRARLEFELAEDTLPVLADATQIRQVVMNLVMNASEAVAESTGIIRVRSGAMLADSGYLQKAHASSDAHPGKYVWFEIDDNGSGMTPEVLTRIFDPFFTTKFTGRGLGLAAVLGIVRSHHGAMHVESVSGYGTRFRVLLPAVGGKAEAKPAGEAQTPYKSTGRVLVVDDEETVRKVSGRILEGMGFTPVFATNGREAISIFTANPDFQFVLLDLTMPLVNGTETFIEIQRIKPGAKVLLMSGYDEQDAISRFATSGLAGFIQKPFNVTQFTQHIRRILG